MLCMHRDAMLLHTTCAQMHTASHYSAGQGRVPVACPMLRITCFIPSVCLFVCLFAHDSVWGTWGGAAIRISMCWRELQLQERLQRGRM